MKARRRLSTARKQQICMAHIMVTRGRLATDLDKLLAPMRELAGDVSESDLRKAIKWALQQVPLRPRQPRRTPHLQLVQ